jgi:hypothetical protein
VVGVLSGLIGIGGGIVIVPVLVLLFSLSQHTSYGAMLALMVPPIGLLAAWTYYKGGFVDLKMAAFICVGFFIGGLLGSKSAVAIPDQLLRKISGITEDDFRRITHTYRWRWSLRAKILLTIFKP